MRSPLRLAAALLALIGLLTGAHAAMLADSTGAATVTIRGQKSPAESKINEDLPPGTIVTTGENGEVIIELLPGIVVKLTPMSEIVIGDVDMGQAFNESNEPIPQAGVTVSAGTMIVMVSDGALALGALAIETPRGSIDATQPGVFAVIVTGEPSIATVTVACGLEGPYKNSFKGTSDGGEGDRGGAFVTTTEGEQIIVPPGSAVVLKPDGTWNIIRLPDVPGINGIWNSAQAGLDRLPGLPNLTPPIAPPFIPNFPPGGNIPPNQPPIVPTPVPTPIPTPVPPPVSP
jgi:hypothetical protein